MTAAQATRHRCYQGPLALDLAILVAAEELVDDKRVQDGSKTVEVPADRWRALADAIRIRRTKD